MCSSEAALLAYHAVSLIKATLRLEHGRQKISDEISGYDLALEIGRCGAQALGGAYADILPEVTVWLRLFDLKGTPANANLEVGLALAFRPLPAYNRWYTYVILAVYS